MKHSIAELLHDESATAGEFALVLPLSMLLLFGIIDAGRYAYAFNQGEKATQIGARWAVVTDPVNPEIASQSYVGETVGGVTLAQGDRIPATALGEISCVAGSCTCSVAPCPSNLTFDSDAYGRLLGRLRQIMPEIDTANLQIEYTGSGLGYAGNPNGMDIAPFVTIRLQDMQFQSILLFGGSVGLPEMSYTLTMEDGSGTTSN